MTFTIHDAEQGSDEWLAARCGLITASAVKHLLTPGLKPANNDKARAFLWDMLGQRLTGYVEPQFVSDAMLRGHVDEIEARAIYGEKVAPVTECGLMVRDFGGFRIGYSPDGLVGDDGLIEVKSRAQKYQAQTIVSAAPPVEYMPQLQCGLLVSGREWLDFISYCGGMPMAVFRVEPNPDAHASILEAVTMAEEWLETMVGSYRAALSSTRWFPTERRAVTLEMML
jgi:hypothetical protein